MSTPKPSSLLAAGVLACITVLVFSVLHDYGPASAIRKFHAALAANDPAALQQVIDEPISDGSVAYLVDYIRETIPRGTQPQIARLVRQQNSVRAAVVYDLPGGDKTAIIWIVDKQDRRLWRINTHATWNILRNLPEG